MLAGISSEYYIRLERGDATGISEGVVDGIVHALQLDDAERRHLLDLLRVASSTRATRRRPAAQRVRPTVQRIMDSMVGTPAFVLNGRLDMLGVKRPRTGSVRTDLRRDHRPAEQRPLPLPQPSGEPVLGLTGTRPPTTPSRCCGPRPAATPTTVTSQTSSASSRPAATSSDAGGPPTTSASTSPAAKRIHHPIVGDLDLPFEFLPLPGDTGQSLLTYTAEPGSPSQEAVDLLASWTTTPRAARLEPAVDED